MGQRFASVLACLEGMCECGCSRAHGADELSLTPTQYQNYTQMLIVLEKGLSFQGCHFVKADQWNQYLMEAACTVKGEGDDLAKTHIVFTEGKATNMNPSAILLRWQERMITYLAHLASHQIDRPAFVTMVQDW